MAFHQMHLIRAGQGTIAARTACGRSIHRAHIATNWDGFKDTKDGERCEKCEASKQAELNRKRDTQKGDDLSGWIPVADPDAWKVADAALIAARRK